MIPSSGCLARSGGIFGQDPKKGNARVGRMPIGPDYAAMFERLRRLERREAER
jgi:hypothetical protein